MAFADWQLPLDQISSTEIEQDPLGIQTAVNDDIQPALPNVDVQLQEFGIPNEELLPQDGPTQSFWGRMGGWQLDCRRLANHRPRLVPRSQPKQASNLDGSWNELRDEAQVDKFLPTENLSLNLRDWEFCTELRGRSQGLAEMKTGLAR